MNKPVIIENARVERFEVWDGVRLVNGRPHGSNWKPCWEAIFRFGSEEEAARFVEAARKLSFMDAHP